MKKSRILCLVLALVMMLSIVACNKTDDNQNENNNQQENNTPNTPDNPDTPSNNNDETANLLIADEDRTDPPADYDTQSDAVYTANLGSFAELYNEATAEVIDIGRRYALMALSEAKLLESAVMMPTATQGGSYAMSRVATRTINSTLWGVDEYRYQYALVADKLILSEDQDALKGIWAESAGTGTYLEKARAYLTEHGYGIIDTYNTSYTGDPQTFDALASSRTVDSEPVVLTIDGLMEYDVENQQKPALAESYEMSADGMTYTFHIRPGVKWVDQQGREIGEVTADDFVAGLQHAFDTHGGLGDLVEGIIVNATEYADGTVTDFSQVGVKAVDKYTLEYDLVYACPYFMSMFGYSVFWPMNRAFYESKGGKFGADFDSSAADYTYGKTPADIAYCGAYLITNYTAGNSFNFEQNPTYWNKDAMNIKSIKWTYYSGEDQTELYQKAKTGEIVSAGLGTAVLTMSREEKPEGSDKSYFDLYHYTSATTATSYMNFYNINRYRYYNFNNETAARSTKTVAQAEATAAALANQHFRMALATSVDRPATRAPLVGEDVKTNAIRNTYTPGTFVSLPNETTVDINGTATTFPAGTFYGEIVQAQLDADGIPIKAWDAANATSDGYDGWYNPEYAVSELNIAIEELKAQGIEVSVDNPIILDYPYPVQRENYTNSAMALKQSTEAVLGGLVIINTIGCEDDDQWYGTGYDTTYGYEANYDMYDLSGWGPDYGDPQTYLDTLIAGGYMAKCIGLY